MGTETNFSEDLVGGLLRAIDERDLHAMERNVQALRGCLRPTGACDSALAERTDALAALADEIERSLRRLRTTAAGEMARIQATAPLLRHVAIGGRSPLAEQ